MPERFFVNFSTNIWTSNISNDITTYTLTRNLAWTTEDTGISELGVTDYITLEENIIVDGGGYTITISEPGHTGIFKIASSISSINNAPIIKNIQINISTGNISTDSGSLVTSEQNYFYIYNCTVSGTLSNANSGGLCGSKCTNNTIKNCISTCTLTGNYCGGIAGADYGYFSSGSSWNQVGNDIYDSSSTNAGWAVAISSDGTIMATGAPYTNAPGGYNEGQVIIYRYESSTWTKKGSYIYGDSGDKYGYSVAISSDGKIVATGSQNANSSTGNVRIYCWSGEDWTSGDWVQKGSDISGDATQDYSGQKISLSADGTIIAIGARGNDGADGTVSNAGQVRVYKWSGEDWTSGNWVQKGSSIYGQAENYTLREVSLSSDGTILATGARGANSWSGNVIIYKWSGEDWTSGNWAQEGSTINGSQNEALGESVDLSSNGLIVAAGSKSGAGIVRIYEWISDDWVQKGLDILGETSLGNSAGESISLSSDGTVIAIGDRHNNDNGKNAGHVRVYQWSGSAWSQVGDDFDGEFAGDYSGLGISLSSNGTILAIGAYSNDEYGSNTGKIQVFELESGSSISSSTNTIENSFFQPDSAITGNYCGGIIGGYTQSSSFTGTITISKCFSDGILDNTDGTVASGGITGYKAGSHGNTLIVNNCFSINTAADGESITTHFAGLLGPDSVGTVTNCYSDASIAHNSTLTESNNYNYSSYTPYASSLPENWSTSIWVATSGYYPRLLVFITDSVWSNNTPNNHQSMNYSLRFSNNVTSYVFPTLLADTNIITELNSNDQIKYDYQFNISNTSTTRNAINTFIDKIWVTNVSNTLIFCYNGINQPIGSFGSDAGTLVTENLSGVAELNSDINAIATNIVQEQISYSTHATESEIYRGGYGHFISFMSTAKTLANSVIVDLADRLFGHPLATAPITNQPQITSNIENSQNSVPNDWTANIRQTFLENFWNGISSVPSIVSGNINTEFQNVNATAINGNNILMYFKYNALKKADSVPSNPFVNSTINFGTVTAKPAGNTISSSDTMWKLQVTM